MDITVDLYLDEIEHRYFSAFVDGTWVQGPLHLSGDGNFGYGQPDALRLIFGTGIVANPSSASYKTFYTLTGTRTDDRTPFAVQVAAHDSIGTVFNATLTAQQISGP